jgi:hypothetical protein
MGGECSMYGSVMRNAYTISIGKRKKLLDRPRRRWKFNIRVKVTEIGCGSLDRNHEAQDRIQ